MSGYTFVDNSELSIGAKIKRYFDINPPDVDSDTDSSFSSIEVDASFEKILERTKMEQKNKTVVPVESRNSIIDLCASPPTPPKQQQQYITPTKFNDTTLDNGNYWFDDSVTSFLEHEKLCIESPSNKENSFFVDHSSEETQLFDVEAPSCLWEDTIGPCSNMSMIAKLTPIQMVGIRRPSTIAEESTINSNDSKESNSNSIEEPIFTAPGLVNSKLNQSQHRYSVFNFIPKKKIVFYGDEDRNLVSSGTATAIQPFNNDAVTNQQSINKECSTIVDTSIDLISFDDTIMDNNYEESELDQAFSVLNFESSMSCESSSDSNNSMNFNDTIEAMDYFIEKGKRLQDKLKTPTTLTPKIIFSPKSQNSLLKTSIHRRILKNMNSPGREHGKHQSPGAALVPKRLADRLN